MTSLKIRAAFALALLLTLCSVPAFAQADEPTAAPVTIEATEAAPTEEISTPVENPADTGEIVTSLYTLIGGAIAVFVAGGLTVGTALLTLATRFRDNPAEMAAIESLASSVPGPVALRMLELASTLSVVGEVLGEAFDGVPATDKDVIAPRKPGDNE